MTLSTLLRPLKLDVVGVQEDEHDYHFRVELPEPKCCESCGNIHNLVNCWWLDSNQHPYDAL